MTITRPMLAMTAAATEIETVAPSQAVDITCEAPDEGILLVDWLNALAYEMAEHGLLFSRFEVEIEAGRLYATAWGEPVDRARHSPAVEIKGATMTELAVSWEDGQWVAQCVVDV